MSDDPPTPFPAGFEEDELVFTVPKSGRVISHPYLRRSGRGPAVILIHELPGFNAATAAFAEILADRGYTVVLPLLLGRPRLGQSLVGVARNTVRICVAREFAALARNTTGEIVDWLEALAAREDERAGNRGIGVIGMCFSGGFALAMVRNERVRASVASQPSLPFSVLPGRWADIGVSARDLERITERAQAGVCVRALRYASDPISPRARLRKIERLPNASVREVPAWQPWKHSVLSNALDADPESDVGKAFAETLDYLARELPVPEPT